MTTRYINPSGPLTFPAMSQAVVVGSTVHLSGQVALDEHGEIVGLGDADAQAEQCFKNIATLVALAGGDLRDVVKLTCYLTSVDVYPAYAKAKLALFKDSPPAGTAVVVAALLDSRFLLEVDAVVILDRGTNGNTEKGI